MFLIQELMQLNKTIPKTIKGKPLSDYSVLTGAYRGTFTVYAQLRLVGKYDKKAQEKIEVGSFDSQEEATEFEKKLIAAGAKPARTDWRA